MAEERKHALLGASGAKRWLNCPPSARLAEQFPEKPSAYADEGTLAHDICELKLRKLFVEPGMPEKDFKAHTKELKENPQYKPEMEKYTDAYVEYIQQIAYSYPTPPTITLEKCVDYGHIAPEGYGFADCIIISGTEMHIVDFKYGKGIPVSAMGNPQLALYAIGALHEYGLCYPVDTVTLHIVQPRIGQPSSWTTSARQLGDWAEAYVKPRAELAFKGEGDFKQGEWCDKCFCQVGGVCRARATENLPILQANMDPVTGKMRDPAVLGDDELAQMLPLLVAAEPWIKKVKAAVVDKLMSGKEIAGWKLVEGRSNRIIKDIDTAYKALIKAGYKKAVLYNQVPITLTEVENLVSKEDHASILAQYIVKPQGAPTLAPIDDKRPEYKKSPTTEEVFGGENTYQKEDK